MRSFRSVFFASSQLDYFRNFSLLLFFDSIAFVIFFSLNSKHWIKLKKIFNKIKPQCSTCDDANTERLNKTRLLKCSCCFKIECVCCFFFFLFRVLFSHDGRVANIYFLFMIKPYHFWATLPALALTSLDCFFFLQYANWH